MSAKRSHKLDPGQGMLFETAPKTEVVEVGDYEFIRSDLDAPATTLADYYGTLAKAVKALGRAHSNGRGFVKLVDSNPRVKEFSHRLDAEPDETKRIVGKTERKHKQIAQDALFKQNNAERKAMMDYAHATGEFTVEYVYENMPAPPSIEEVEHVYFDDPNSSAKELQAKRAQLYRRADHYGQAAPNQVA